MYHFIFEVPFRNVSFPYFIPYKWYDNINDWLSFQGFFFRNVNLDYLISSKRQKYIWLILIWNTFLNFISSKSYEYITD